ncbi:hypothetical protein [Paenibacillus glucanolyticus]|uniref:hypothetical protein n=1 Tax=Paenibacillus glucanolyticus TaxID=59843 RepID=UPI0015C409BB|nr:hypothetical protein [Paenibacillus glucanolyticus]
MSGNDDVLYNEAMDRIDELVQEVIEICDKVAEDNDYEKDWVLERFREKFNKAKRKLR